MNGNSTIQDDGNPAHRLCTSCGFCCDGTMFATGSIYQNENLDYFRKQGVQLATRENKPVFLQPCPKFDKICTIYRERFRVCRDFRCALLRRTEAGQCSPEYALQEIGAAKILADQARTLLKEMGCEDTSVELTNRCRRALNSPPSDSAPEAQKTLYGRLALVTHALTERLNHSFYLPPKEDSASKSSDRKMS